MIWLTIGFLLLLLWLFMFFVCFALFFYLIILKIFSKLIIMHRHPYTLYFDSSFLLHLLSSSCFCLLNCLLNMGVCSIYHYYLALNILVCSSKRDVLFNSQMHYQLYKVTLVKHFYCPDSSFGSWPNEVIYMYKIHCRVRCYIYFSCLFSLLNLNCVSTTFFGLLRHWLFWE